MVLVALKRYVFHIVGDDVVLDADADRGVNATVPLGDGPRRGNFYGEVG